MNTFKLTITDRLATIQLDRGRSNPINHDMVKELISAVKDLDADREIGGLILTGKEGFFSSGIDLIEAYNYDEAKSREFWTDFLHLQVVLASFRKPMVAAISGHSPAGGCIMAICCDYRLMAEGKFIIGLNEVPVGIIVPDSVFSVYSFWLGQHKAYQYLMEGRLLNVDEALKAGLIDEVTTADDLLAATEKRVRAYMQFSPKVWSQTKLNLRKQLLAQLNTDQTETLDMMLKQWWAPSTRKGLEIMIEQLTAKKS